MKRYLNVGVKGCASWPSEEKKIQFEGHELILKPATKETEQSIHIDVKSIDHVAALTIINRFLSILSWCDNQAMENLYGWSGNPVPVAVPLKKRIVGSSMYFIFDRGIEDDPRAKLALALYREGLTINSKPFQFLSYFKILNIFWQDKFKKGKNELIEGLREYLEKLKYKLAVERSKKIEEEGHDVADYLYKSCRCAIAHAYADPIVDPDDVKDLRRLSEDIYIIKEIAELLITNELGISKIFWE